MGYRLPYEFMNDHDLAIYLSRESVGLGQNFIFWVVLDVADIDGLRVQRL